MGDLEQKLGELLKLERERQKKELEDIAETLRIAESSLLAVEAGDPDALPSPIYFGLFAKSYAEQLGIDYTATTEAIKEEIGVDRPARKKKAKQASAKPAEGTTDLPDAEGDEEAPSKKMSRGQLLTYIASAVVVVAAGYFLLDQFGFGGGVNGNGTAGEPDGGGIEAVYAEYDWNVPPYQAPDSLMLKLTPRGESWATILADGDTVIFRNLVPGRVYNVAAQYRMTMSVAVPRAVDIDLNGRRINPVSPETGRISRVEITQMNVDSLINYVPPKQDETKVPVRQRERSQTVSEAPTGEPEATTPDTSGRDGIEF